MFVFVFICNILGVLLVAKNLSSPRQSAENLKQFLSHVSHGIHGIHVINFK